MSQSGLTITDKSEAEARIEAALKIARETIAACEKADPDKGGHAIAFAMSLALTRIIAKLEKATS